MIFRLRTINLCLIVVIILSGCTPVLSIDTQPDGTATQVTATSIPMATNLPATLTPLPSPTSTSTLKVTPMASVHGNTFIFIAETIPDGTNFQPGQIFQKTWTLKNGGN